MPTSEEFKRSDYAAKMLLTAANLSGDWVPLDTICTVRDYVLQHFTELFKSLPKGTLATREALSGPKYKRATVNMLRRCAALSNTRLCRARRKDGQIYANQTNYAYKLLTA